jgi:DNA-binding response OmpR family regulator
VTKPLLLITSDLFWSSRLRTLLESRGYPVATARGEAEVREALKGEPLGAILDLSAPGALGLLALLRKGVTAVPVLAFTGHTDTSAIERARALGARVAVRGEVASRGAELVAETFGPPAP